MEYDDGSGWFDAIGEGTRGADHSAGDDDETPHSNFVPVAKAALGDLIYFPPQEDMIGHVGIVISDQEWIGSQSSTGVAVVKMNNPYWRARRSEFLRYRPLNDESGF